MEARRSAAGRALAPSSKLEATRWFRKEVQIDGLVEADHTSCYRAMDWLLDHLKALQETVFFAIADLLTLMSTGSSSIIRPIGGRTPRRGHSKDSRPDLAQIGIGMAVTTGGLPVRLWVWSGKTGDRTILAQVK